MLHSMTGYGRGEATSNVGTVTCEIRAVNHRFCELVLRIPRVIAMLEDKVRHLVQQSILRGRLEITVNLRSGEAGNRRVYIDTDLAMSYYNNLKELREKLGVDGDITLDVISRLPEVTSLKETETDVDSETLWPLLEEAVTSALTALVAMRQREGSAMAQNLAERVETLHQLQAEMAERADGLPAEYQERLRRRLADLLELHRSGPSEIDAGRLETEVALLAERADVSEELLRLQSHLDQFALTLQGSGTVGRKLDFLIQELNREVNTIGSKASDLDLTRHVLAAKAELEKMREQVQNIE